MASLVSTSLQPDLISNLLYHYSLWPLPSTSLGRGFNTEQQNRFKELLLQSWNSLSIRATFNLNETGDIPVNLLLDILSNVKLPEETKEEPRWREQVEVMKNLISQIVQGQVQQQSEQSSRTRTIEEWIARLKVEPNPNSAKIWETIQPGDNSVGCQLLTDLLSWIDRIHDAFGKRNDLDVALVPYAQQYIWERIQLLGERRKTVADGSPAYENMALYTFDMIMKEMTELVGSFGVNALTDDKMQNVVKDVIEDPKSIIQYYSIASFCQRIHDDYYEIGIIVAAGLRENAGQKLDKLINHGLPHGKSLDKGAMETFLFLQTQPSIFEKIKAQFGHAADNDVGKCLIISDLYSRNELYLNLFLSDRNVRKRAELPQWRSRLRHNNNFRQKCSEMSCIRILSGEFPPVEHVYDIIRKKVVNPAYQTKFALTERMNKGYTVAEERMISRYKIIKDIANHHGSLDFPTDFLKIIPQDQSIDIYLDPDICRVCPVFSQVDMHPAANVLGIGPHQRNINGLRGTWPLGDTTPAAGQCMAQGQYVELIPSAVDPAKAIFKANWPSVIAQAVKDAINNVESDQVSINSMGNLLLTSLGFYSPHLKIPKIGLSGLPKNVRLDIKTLLALRSNDIAGNMVCDFIPVLLAEKNQKLTNLESFSALNNILLKKCGGVAIESDPTYQAYRKYFQMLQENIPREDVVKLMIAENIEIETRNEGKTSKKKENLLEPDILGLDPKKPFTQSNCVGNGGCVCDSDSLQSSSDSFQYFVDCWSGVGQDDNTKKRDHRKSMVNWCPCHGAFVGNFESVVRHQCRYKPAFCKIISKVAPGFVDFVTRNISYREMVSYKIYPSRSGGGGGGSGFNANWPKNWRVAQGLKPDIFTPIFSILLEKTQTHEGISLNLGRANAEEGIFLEISGPFSLLMQISANKSILYSLNDKERAKKMNPISGEGFSGDNDDHLYASGTLYDEQSSFAGSLEKLDSIGLGICNTSCGCRGLCLGNQLWAGMGILMLNHAINVAGGGAGGNTGFMDEVLRSDGALCISALITCVEQEKLTGMSVVNAIRGLLEILRPTLNGTEDAAYAKLSNDDELERLYVYASTSLFKTLSSEDMSTSLFPPRVVVNDPNKRKNLIGTIVGVWPTATVNTKSDNKETQEMQNNTAVIAFMAKLAKKKEAATPGSKEEEDLYSSCIIKVLMENGEIIYMINSELGGGEWNPDDSWKPYIHPCQAFIVGHKIGIKDIKGVQIRLHYNTLCAIAEKQNPVAAATMDECSALPRLFEPRISARAAADLASMANPAPIVGDEEVTNRIAINTLKSFLQAKIQNIRDTYASNISLEGYSYTADDIDANSDVFTLCKTLLLSVKVDGESILVEAPTATIKIKRIDARPLASVIYYLVEQAGELWGNASAWSDDKRNALDKCIDMATGVKTYGDLHQLTSPLQVPNQAYSEYAAALMTLITGDFTGTGFGCTFCREERGYLIAPRICYTSGQKRVQSSATYVAGAHQESETRPMCYLPMILSRQSQGNLLAQNVIFRAREMEDIEILPEQPYAPEGNVESDDPVVQATDYGDAKKRKRANPEQSAADIARSKLTNLPVFQPIMGTVVDTHPKTEGPSPVIRTVVDSHAKTYQSDIVKGTVMGTVMDSSEGRYKKWLVDVEKEWNTMNGLRARGMTKREKIKSLLNIEKLIKEGNALEKIYRVGDKNLVLNHWLSNISIEGEWLNEEMSGGGVKSRKRRPRRRKTRRNKKNRKKKTIRKRRKRGRKTRRK